MATNLTEFPVGQGPGRLLHIAALDGDKSNVLHGNIELRQALGLVVAAFVILYAFLGTNHANNEVKAPFVGWTWPSLSRIQFFFKSNEIIMTGWNQVGAYSNNTAIQL